MNKNKKYCLLTLLITTIFLLPHSGNSGEASKDVRKKRTPSQKEELNFFGRRISRDQRKKLDALRLKKESPKIPAGTKEMPEIPISQDQEGYVDVTNYINCWNCFDGHYYHLYSYSCRNANGEPNFSLEGTPCNDQMILTSSEDEDIVGPTGVRCSEEGSPTSAIYANPSLACYYASQEEMRRIIEIFVKGKAGDDFIDVSGLDQKSPFLLDELLNFWIFGDEGDDTIIGWDGPEWQFGRLGNDKHFGGAGADWLNGGEGNDCSDSSDGGENGSIEYTCPEL